MKALVVSLGSIGKRHLRNLRAIAPDAEIAVLRLTGGAADEAIAAGANAAFQTLDASFAFAPDIAIIASPAPFHIPVALEFARRGTHLLIEKPLSNTLEGLDELERVTAEKNVCIAVGYNFRHYHPLQIVKEAIQEGRIGRVLSIRAEVGQYLPEWRPATDYRRGVTARQEMGGGVVLELSHEIDYVRWLAGDVISVMAQVDRVSDLEIDVEDTAEMILRHENGAIGSIHVDMIERAPGRTCRISGTDGTIAWDYFAQNARLYAAAAKSWSVLHSDPTFDRNEMYVEEMKNFLDCATGKATPRATLADGRKALEIALAAKRSAATGARVDL